MIAKITAGANVQGLVNYQFKEKSELVASSRIYDYRGVECHESNSPFVKEVIKETIREWNAENEGRTKQPNFHASLSFHKKDLEFTEEKDNLKAVADEFMEEMGYEDQPYAVFLHTDKEHPHIHIISTRINENGRKINDWQEKNKSIKICEKIERAYNLTQAKKEGKKRVPMAEKELPKIIKEHKAEPKHALTKILENAIIYAIEKKPKSDQEYREKLHEKGVKLTITKRGFLYQLDGAYGYRLRAKDIGTTIPTRPKLREQFKKNIQKTQAKKPLEKEKEGERIRKFLAYFKRPEHKDFQNVRYFKDFLQNIKPPIEVIFHRKATGDDIGGIRGVSFKSEGKHYTGSEIGLKTADFEFITQNDDQKEKQEYINHWAPGWEERKKTNRTEQKEPQEQHAKEQGVTAGDIVSRACNLKSGGGAPEYDTEDPKLWKKKKRKKRGMGR